MSMKLFLVSGHQLITFYRVSICWSINIRLTYLLFLMLTDTLPVFIILLFIIKILTIKLYI